MSVNFCGISRGVKYDANYRGISSEMYNIVDTEKTTRFNFHRGYRNQEGLWVLILIYALSYVPLFEHEVKGVIILVVEFIAEYKQVNMQTGSSLFFLFPPVLQTKATLFFDLVNRVCDVVYDSFTQRNVCNNLHLIMKISTLRSIHLDKIMTCQIMKLK